ncbi:hypothetical protein C0992_010751, partial [Termitomyces sp. T32_za158]
GVAFEYDGEFRVEVPEDRGNGEGFLEKFEDALTLTVPVPQDLLSGEAGQGLRDAGVIVNESSVEVGEAQERLNLLDIPGTRPVEDSINL